MRRLECSKEFHVFSTLHFIGIFIVGKIDIIMITATIKMAYSYVIVFYLRSSGI